MYVWGGKTLRKSGLFESDLDGYGWTRYRELERLGMRSKTVEEVGICPDRIKGNVSRESERLGTRGRTIKEVGICLGRSKGRSVVMY